MHFRAIGVYLFCQLEITLGSLPIAFPNVLPRQSNTLLQGLFRRGFLGKYTLGCANASSQRHARQQHHE